MRSGRVPAIVAVILVVWLPALAQNDTDLASVRAELERLQSESQELSAQYQAAWAEDAELQTRIKALESSVSTYGIERRRLRDQIRERAVSLYMDGVTGSDLPSLFLSASPSELDTRSEYLRDLRQQDQALLNNLETLTRQLQGFVQDLRRDKQEQEIVLARLERLSIELNERLEEGQAAYALLEQREAEEQARREAEEQARREAEEQARREAEEQARREAEEEAARAATTVTTGATTTTAADQPTTTTSPPATAGTTATTQPTTTSVISVTDTTFANPAPATPDEQEGGPAPSGGMVCPVDGFSTFTDTWGAPRSGGRLHQGVDFLAARGTPVVAVEPGLVERMRKGGLGGITVWLQGDSGADYYYAHLDAWAPGLSAGQRVSAGQQLGVVGTTGNSPAHIPHLHWEYHPDGFASGARTAVNPTPLAYRLCG